MNDTTLEFLKEAMFNIEEGMLPGATGDTIQRKVPQRSTLGYGLRSHSIYFDELVEEEDMEDAGRITELISDGTVSSVDRNPSIAGDTLEVMEILNVADLPDATKKKLERSLNETLSDENDLLVQTPDNRLFLLQGPIYPVKIMDKLMKTAEPKDVKDLEIEFESYMTRSPELEKISKQLIHNYEQASEKDKKLL